MLKYRSAVSGRMVTTVFPGPSFLASFRAAATLVPLEMPHIMVFYSDPEDTIRREAQAAAKRVPEDTGVSEGIRLALKSLSR